MKTYRDIRLWEPSHHDIDHVCRQLRPSDRAEVQAVRFDERMGEFAAFLDASRYGAVQFLAAGARSSAFPAVLFGVWQWAPGNGMAQLVGTKDFYRIAGTLTRYMRREFIPAMHRAGLNRVTVHAMTAFEDNCRWIESLGAVPECDCKNWGKDGQTYRQYVWHRKESEPCAE